MNLPNQKVTPSHLKRDAFLYVRQSTLRQVLENTESTLRQYALRDRAVALGWPVERVVVIDTDLGQSGASSTDRIGFQKLVTEVGMGNAGIVLGLEVSRLARSSTDWHRLLEICALTNTLILDEDGLYDPGHFNDRLLLGLKGTMSEAELHIIRSRLRGGIENKASRGDLKQPLPVGFIYDPNGRVVLHPDLQIQQAVRLLFQTFRRTGSAFGTVKAFREQGLEFPRRLQNGPRNGEIVWVPLQHSRVLQILKNPRYAGAFFFGRTLTRKTIAGKSKVRVLPRDEWHTLIRDAHNGYITWSDYEENLRHLREAAQALGHDRRKSPPREGPALLQGLAICGICGERMTVRYHVRQGHQYPDYVCSKENIQHGGHICQRIPGEALDLAIGDLLLETVSPLALEVALSVQNELQSRLDEADRLRKQKVERARYNADLAKRRFMQVDPDNRLVADVLEAEWNQSLQELNWAQDEYNRQRDIEATVYNEEQRRQILTLATDFPRLWQNPKTPDRERKRIVRLILEDVTLIKKDKTTAHIRFRGGAMKVLELPLPLSAPELRKTSPLVVQEVNRLLEYYTESEVADILNKRGFVTGTGLSFTFQNVQRIRKAYGLADRYTRLRRAGLLSLKEMAEKLGIVKGTIHQWRRRGLLKAQSYTERGDYLYELPDEKLPGKFQHKKKYQLCESTNSERRGGAV